MTDYHFLIPPPNNNKPKFMTWLDVLLTPLLDAQALATRMTEYFQIEQAVGVQLDMLGQILGVARRVNFEPTNPSDSAILTDDNYRLCLLAKVIQNQWMGTKQEIEAFWSTYFPQYAIDIQDNQNMTMDVIIHGMTDQLQQDLVNNHYIVPKPAGVLVNYTFSSSKLFGYGLETDFIGGYGESNWA